MQEPQQDPDGLAGMNPLVVWVLMHSVKQTIHLSEIMIRPIPLTHRSWTPTLLCGQKGDGHFDARRSWWLVHVPRAWCSRSAVCRVARALHSCVRPATRTDRLSALLGNFASHGHSLLHGLLLNLAPELES